MLFNDICEKSSCITVDFVVNYKCCVESYKKNMFALLGKPGYEAAREELLKRL